jgi:hypothetical protein
VARYLARLAGTRAAGLVLTRQDPAGKWAAATYVLNNTAPTEQARHRTHRTHRTDEPEGGVTLAPMSPMSPMPDALVDGDVPPGAEAEI